MAASPGVQALVFRVGDLVCGADVAAVREIVAGRPATRLPGAPESVTGLINVRGDLVTLVDGRRVLGRTEGDGGAVVLLRVAERTVGFTVDEVIDLVTIPDDEISPREELPGVDPRVVAAVGRRGDSSLVILDLDALLGPVLSE